MISWRKSRRPQLSAAERAVIRRNRKKGNLNFLAERTRFHSRPFPRTRKKKIRIIIIIIIIIIFFYLKIEKENRKESS
jgi:t-SNARE complex subunit (syntaxin)